MTKKPLEPQNNEIAIHFTVAINFLKKLLPTFNLITKMQSKHVYNKIASS
jgi:hypothetical protein